METDITYTDGLITITHEAVVFHNYYFPGVSKTVPFSDIEKINEYEPTVLNGKWRLWGSGSFNIWFPLDIKRPSRDCIFYVSLKDTTFRIGFTVKDSSNVENIFREMHLIA